MDIKTLGIDLAKNVFKLHGVDAQGKTVLKKRISRSELANYIAKILACLIGMESCGSANYSLQARIHVKTAMSIQM